MRALLAATWAAVTIWRAVLFSREMSEPAFPWADFDVDWNQVPAEVKRAARRAWIRGRAPADIRGALYVIRAADTWRSLRLLTIATTFLFPAAVVPLVIVDPTGITGTGMAVFLGLGLAIPWVLLRRWRAMLAGERLAADMAWRASGRG